MDLICLSSTNNGWQTLTVRRAAYYGKEIGRIRYTAEGRSTYWVETFTAMRIAPTTKETP